MEIEFSAKCLLFSFLDLMTLIEPAVTIDDVIGAVEGILRLQATFLISPSDASLH